MSFHDADSRNLESSCHELIIYANAKPLQPGSSLPSKIKSIAINEHMVHPKKKEPISEKHHDFWKLCDLLQLKLEILKIFKYNSHHPSPDVRCTDRWSPPGVALM